MKESILRKGSQATGFKLLFLALTLLSFNGLTANRSVLTWIAYAVTAVGAAVLVIRVVCFKKYLHAKGLFLLIAFCGSYALSALLTRQYGLSENAKALVWMAFQYFILYTYDTTSDGTAEKKEFYIISHFFMAYTLLAVAAGTVMLFADYYSYTEVNGVVVILGFLWNRLWGVYSDPNYGAVFSAITIIMSLYFYKDAKKPLKALYIINIVLQICYIAFSDSRTGMVSLFCALLVYVYLTALRSKKLEAKKAFARGVICVLLAVTAAVASFAAIKVVSVSTSEFKKWQYEHIISSDKDKTDAQKEKDKQKLEIGRQSNDINGDVSNRRFAIWGSGLEIFKTKPLTGVTFRNYVPYAEDKLPDTYLVNNDFIEFHSMHNSFVDILVSQGILGVVIIAAYIILVLVLIFKNFFKFKDEKYKYHTALLSIIAPIFASMMFYSETFYMNTGGAFLFWLALGYLVQSVTSKNSEAKEITPGK